METREASHYRSGLIERQARVSNAHQFRRQRARSVTDRVSTPCPLCPAACPLPLDVLLRIGAATAGQHRVSNALWTMLCFLFIGHLIPSLSANSRVYDSRHLQADCQEPGSAPLRNPTLGNRVWVTFTFLSTCTSVLMSNCLIKS